jgi:hypothetical protein
VAEGIKEGKVNCLKPPMGLITAPFHERLKQIGNINRKRKG